MEYYQGRSVKIDIWEAVLEAAEAFRGEKPDFILFFSDGRRFAAISQAMHELFPHTVVVAAVPMRPSLTAGSACEASICWLCRDCRFLPAT